MQFAVFDQKQSVLIIDFFIFATVPFQFRVTGNAKKTARVIDEQTQTNIQINLQTNTQTTKPTGRHR